LHQGIALGIETVVEQLLVEGQQLSAVSMEVGQRHQAGCCHRLLIRG
jgi:hypothetical protein